MELLIDIRTEDEYGDGHIENSINIPMTEILGRIDEIAKDKNREIRLYCMSGRRSALVKKILHSVGYKNVINEGGYEELKGRHIEKKVVN